jgi:hypothetical protein
LLLNVSLLEMPIESLDGHLRIEVARNRAIVRRRGQGRVASLSVRSTRLLTVEEAQNMLKSGINGRDWLVIFERASPPARDLLRKAHISYATPDGEVFLMLPSLLVDLPGRRSRTKRPSALVSGDPGIAPFTRRAARVARWLLLHAEATPTITELARQTQLSRPFTSQVAKALSERALVELGPELTDGRVRRIRLEHPGALAVAWGDEWRRRRHRELTWDIGTGTIQDTVAAWRSASVHAGPRPWAVGGLAGAQFLVRAAEPADVLIWVNEDDLLTWQDLLLAQQVPRGRALLRVAVAPDPWALGLSWIDSGISIADPAQLYLDCYSEGERALEGAAAVRGKLGW